MFSWIKGWFVPGTSFPLEFLPNDTLLELFLRLSLRELYNLCRVNQHLKSLLDDEFFWKNKCFRDFGETEPIGTWKETYKEITFGTVFVFGANEYGQLGLGDIEERGTPVQLPLRVKVKDVSVGNYHTIILDLAGNVLTFGRNNYGQLGIGQIDDEPHPNPCVLPGIKAKAVFAGPYQSFFITSGGDVYACGDNTRGQLGIKGESYVCTPRQIFLPGNPREPLKASYVSSCTEYTAIVTPEGTIRILDAIYIYDQIGIKVKPQGVVASMTLLLAIDTDSTVWIIRPIGSVPSFLHGMKVKSISMSYFHGAFIDLDGSVYTYGRNGSLLTGFHRNEGPNIGPIELPGIKGEKIAVGNARCLIIDHNRSIWSFYRDILEGDGQQFILKRISGIKARCVSTMDTHSIILGKSIDSNKRFIIDLKHVFLDLEMAFSLL